MADTTVPLADAAIRLSEAPAAVFHRIVRGELAGFKDRHSWRIDLASLERLLAEKTGTTR